MELLGSQNKMLNMSKAGNVPFRCCTCICCCSSKSLHTCTKPAYQAICTDVTRICDALSRRNMARCLTVYLPLHPPPLVEWQKKTQSVDWAAVCCGDIHTVWETGRRCLGYYQSQSSRCFWANIMRYSFSLAAIVSRFLKGFQCSVFIQA